MFGLTQKTADTLETVADFFLNSSDGKAVIARAKQDEAIKRSERRNVLAAEKARLEANDLAAARTHVTARAPLVAIVDRCKASLREAETRLNALDLARRLAALDADIQRGRLEGELRASASPLIEECADRLRTLAAAGWNEVTTQTIGGDLRVVWSNRPSVEVRRTAIRVALQTTLEELRLAPLEEAELARTLDRLVTRLPTVEAVPREYATS